MELVSLIIHHFFAFIVILSIIVFIHEFGHYYIAKKCGVKVDEFSIGFGKELFGFNDKSGTRWKFCLLPLGGFVKMFGDRNPSSAADHEKLNNLNEQQKKISFFYQPVLKRFAIVFAGPVINFLLGIVILFFIFKAKGVAQVKPIISEILPNSAAYESGLLVGDKIIQANNVKITDFSRLQEITSINIGTPITLKIIRQNQTKEITLTPKIVESKDVFGNDIKTPLIGISADNIAYVDLSILGAAKLAVVKTYDMSTMIFQVLGQLIAGDRSVKDLGGPVKIAKYSGQAVDLGFFFLLYFMAMISINLGVMNLLPIPGLDGGHLFYYLIEMIKGSPLSMKVQEFGLRVGFSVLITFMIFITYFDIVSLFK